MPPPIYVKGGVWTNVEDQVLKAAVSKYGLTQWARVASLLPKKTAKQAKARWTEYLNPTLARGPWTPEEDEKLLSLATLLPNQWRSIAPIVGRTPAQCVEHYQKLIDEQVGTEGSELGLTGDSIETMPALGNAYEGLASRPDLEEMDEDELEMLSEAKARLANSQGKKAKRKERARNLAESKRLALLERRRELKASGADMTLQPTTKKKEQFDYNADIFEERGTPQGKFDVATEEEQNLRDKTDFLDTVKVQGVQEPKKKKAKTQKSHQSEIGTTAPAPNKRKLELPDAAQPKRKVIKGKSLSKTLRAIFSALPPPQNNVDIPMPFVDKMPPQSKQEIANLQLLQDVAAQLEIVLRSQVLRRGLQPLNPDKLKKIELDRLSELDKRVAQEFMALVKLDFYVVESQLPPTVQPVDAKYLARVQAEFDKMATQAASAPIDIVVSEEGEVQKEDLELIERYNDAAERVSLSITESDLQVRHESTVAERLANIQDLAEQLADETIKENVAKQQLKLEKAAIENHSRRLHEVAERAAIAAESVID